MTRALDYATRSAIGTVIAEELRTVQLRGTIEPRQLHGPCSDAAERFVLGCILLSPQTPQASHSVPISRRRRAREREQGPHCPPAALGLQPSDFWSQLHGRYFEAMLAVDDPTDEGTVVHWLFEHDRLSGPAEPFLSELAALRRDAAPLAALFDVASAVRLILDRARERRLVAILARLADGICAGSESVETAKLALREFFVAER